MQRWLDGRHPIPNATLLGGMIRLFLAAPETVKLETLLGRPGDTVALSRHWRAAKAGSASRAKGGTKR